MFVTSTSVEAIGEDAKGERLSLRSGFLCVSAVRENAGNFWHFRQPSPVVFSLVLDGEMHVVLYRWRDFTLDVPID